MNRNEQLEKETIEKRKSQIIEECWNKGSETNKRRLDRFRFIVETFAYNCMEALEKENNFKGRKEMAEEMIKLLRDSTYCGATNVCGKSKDDCMDCKAINSDLSIYDYIKQIKKLGGLNDGKKH